MSIDWGPVPANSVLPFLFTSHDAATGANETMSGLALADIVIYKDVSLTQRSSTNGFAFFGGDADGLDLDTFAGVNGVSIDLSDNSDAGFYAVGSFYTVVLGPVTIDTQTVYTVLGTFRIVAAEAITGKPKVDVDGWLGTAAATPTVNGVPEVDVTHVAGSTTSVSTLATSIATLLAAIGALADAAADGDPTNTDTAMSYLKQLINILIGSAGIVAWPAAAAPGNAVSLAEAVRYVSDQIGVAGAGLTAADDAVLAAIAGLNNISTAQVNAEVDTALADYDGPTHAEMTAELATADDAVLAAIAALNNLSANAAADALLDRANAVDTYTPRQALRIVLAALAGKVSGADTNAPVFRAADDSKNRITATVDADGNRSAVTLDAT